MVLGERWGVVFGMKKACKFSGMESWVFTAGEMRRRVGGEKERRELGVTAGCVEQIET